MEILERGKCPLDYTYTARCNTCQTLMRFQRKEANFSSDQRDGDFLTVTCPVCDKSVHIAVKLFDKE